MANVKEIYEQLEKLLKENPEIAKMDILEGGGEPARLNIFRDSPDGPITYLSFEDERYMETYVDQAKELIAETNIVELSEQHMEYLIQMCLQEQSEETMKQFIKEYGKSMVDVCKDILSEQTELAETDFIFDDDLYGCQDFENEEVDGYVWAVDKLVNRLVYQAKKELSSDIFESIENINFYPRYNLRTGEISLIGGYDFTEEGKIKDTCLGIPLSDKEKTILKASMDAYCQKKYKQSCLEFVNEGRAEENLSPLVTEKKGSGLDNMINSAENRSAEQNGSTKDIKENNKSLIGK